MEQILARGQQPHEAARREGADHAEQRVREQVGRGGQGEGAVAVERRVACHHAGERGGDGGAIREGTMASSTKTPVSGRRGWRQAACL